MTHVKDMIDGRTRCNNISMLDPAVHSKEFPITLQELEWFPFGLYSISSCYKNRFVFVAMFRPTVRILAMIDLPLCHARYDLDHYVCFIQNEWRSVLVYPDAFIEYWTEPNPPYDRMDKRYPYIPEKMFRPVDDFDVEDEWHPHVLARTPSPTRDPLECSICFTNTPSVLFMPCKHLKTCSTCSSQLYNCPFCQMPIDQKIDGVFL